MCVGANVDDDKEETKVVWQEKLFSQVGLNEKCLSSTTGKMRHSTLPMIFLARRRILQCSSKLLFRPGAAISSRCDEVEVAHFVI